MAGGGDCGVVDVDVAGALGFVADVIEDESGSGIGEGVGNGSSPAAEPVDVDTSVFGFIDRIRSLPSKSSAM